MNEKKNHNIKKLFSIFRMNERFECWGLIYTQSTCLLAQLLHNIASLAAYQSSHVIVQVFHCVRILLLSYSFVIVFFCYRILLLSYSFVIVFFCYRILLFSHSFVMTLSPPCKCYSYCTALYIPDIRRCSFVTPIFCSHTIVIQRMHLKHSDG